VPAKACGHGKAKGYVGALAPGKARGNAGRNEAEQACVCGLHAKDSGRPAASGRLRGGRICGLNGKGVAGGFGFGDGFFNCLHGVLLRQACTCLQWPPRPGGGRGVHSSLAHMSSKGKGRPP
jgi:hypothetical protein